VLFLICLTETINKLYKSLHSVCTAIDINCREGSKYDVIAVGFEDLGAVVVDVGDQKVINGVEVTEVRQHKLLWLL